MRDGLSREFPEALNAVAWTRARVGRDMALWGEPAFWATISAVGAGLIVSAVVQTLVGLTVDVFQALRSPMPFPLFPLVAIAGSAAVATVALRAGGPVALGLAVAYDAAGVALRIPAVRTLCERSGFDPLGPGQCTAVGFLTSLWPQFVGIGLGILIARAVSTRGEGINSLLRIAGAYAIALFVMSLLWTLTDPQTTSVLSSGLTIAAVISAAAVTAGVIAARLPHGVRNAAIVAGVWLLPWAALQLPYLVQNLSTGVPEDNAASMIAGTAAQPIASALLVLSAAVASRARFIPREPA